MTGLEIFYKICLLLGGLAVFMFGMKILGDGLENLAGNKIKVLLGKATSNRFAGVAVGTGVTAIIQSSSATTVMLVGFVNVGLMTLTQAASVILGANIGTTVTLQIVSLKAYFDVTAIVSLFAAVGLFMTLFAKRKRTEKIGVILIALGMLFIGLEFMSNATEAFRELPAFNNIFQTVTNPFLLILIGFIFTAIIQSSSAATTILAGFVVAGGASGGMSIDCAFYAVLGMNLGTCVTAVISSMGTTVNAKRTAFFHFLVKLIGCVVFGLILYFFMDPILDFFVWISGPDPTRQLANFHTIFNVLLTLLLLPLLDVLVKLTEKIISGKDEEQKGFHLYYLDERLLETPPVAVAEAVEEIHNMADIVERNLNMAVDAFFTHNITTEEKIRHTEEEIDFLTDAITKFLVKISSLDITFDDEKLIGTLFHVITDLERVGDYADNMINYAVKMHNNGWSLSEGAEREVHEMYELVMEHFRVSMEAQRTCNLLLLNKVAELEDLIDDKKASMSDSHVRRLNKGTCSAEVGAIFLSVTSNFERIADHMTNVAFSIKDYTKSKSMSVKKLPTA